MQERRSIASKRVCLNKCGQRLMEFRQFPPLGCLNRQHAQNLLALQHCVLLAACRSVHWKVRWWCVHPTNTIQSLQPELPLPPKAASQRCPPFLWNDIVIALCVRGHNKHIFLADIFGMQNPTNPFGLLLHSFMANSERIPSLMTTVSMPVFGKATPIIPAVGVSLSGFLMTLTCRSSR